MGRLPYPDTDQTSGDVRRVYDEFMKVRGNIPNMFRTLAHSPSLMTATYDYFKRVMSGGKVSIKLKEMAAVRVSQNHLCDFGLASHTVLAKRFGVTDEQIGGMKNLDQRAELFDEKEIAALQYADMVNLGASGYSLNFSENCDGAFPRRRLWN